jgi:hypothetical protein
MDILVVVMQTIDDELPALRIVVYSVVTFEGKLRFK